MMLRKFKGFIFFLLVLSNGLTNAQEIKPGSMTTGLAEYKASTSVDHATGILNYNIPLLNAGQDGFTVPINLNYSAGGIKVEEKAGLAGFGWTLHTGGCSISRVMRGSAPDEDPQGILFNPTSSPPLPYGRDEVQYLQDVNGGFIDAESDIFTLNLRGKTVRFVLELDHNNPNYNAFIVRPLEQTDIKIECNYNWMIYGWTVTDSEGNVYELGAASPGNVVIRGGGPSGSHNAPIVTSWVVNKIKMHNNGEIDFVYDKEYVDVVPIESSQFVGYNQPLSLPAIATNDEGLTQELYQKRALYSGYSDKIDQLIQLCYMAQSQADGLSRNLSDGPNGNLGYFLNKSQADHYQWEADQYDFLLQYALVDLGWAVSDIEDVVMRMYTETRYKYHDYAQSKEFNYFVNKPIKRIHLKNAIIEFTYKTNKTWYEYRNNVSVPVSSYAYDRIDYTTLSGDIIKSIVFDVAENGFLNKVQVLNARQEVESEYSFDYYNYTNGEPSPNSQDYWGYFNGKENASLLPNDMYYEYSVVRNNNLLGVTLFNDDTRWMGGYWDASAYLNLIMGGGGYPVPDRTPDAAKAMDRTLKTIATNKGEKIKLQYEGNEIYSDDIGENVPVGGIRIKSVEVNDGISSIPIKTSYRYSFPLLTDGSVMKSSGRLNEWGKSAFAVPYNHPYGTDIYIFSHPVYKGTLYEDNSNNGVFYHYIEEVHPNQSYTGYKYLAIDALKNEYAVHNPMYDQALLASVDYDVSGKIVKIARNKYAYGANQGVGVGNRIGEYNLLQPLNEYFTEEGARNNAYLIEQIKKEPVYLRSNTVKSAYVDDFVNYTYIRDHFYGLNPYRDIYVPNFQVRCDLAVTPNKYSVLWNQALLLKEQEEFYVDDYDPQTLSTLDGSSQLLDEKAYLYERVLHTNGINKVQNKMVYDYENPTHTYVTKTSILSSDGSSKIITMKYPQDLSDPVSTAMVSKHILSPVLETKTYQLKGGVETLLSTEQTNFKQVGDLIVPDQIKASIKNDALQSRTQFNKYDTYGHVLEQQKANDVKEVYLWGYKAQYVVAKILNTTYDVAKTYISQSVLDEATGNGDDDAIRLHLNNLRTIPGALVTTYTYKPLVGVSSETNANNQTTYSEYDASGRLALIRDQNRNILKKYCYTSNGQAEDCSVLSGGSHFFYSDAIDEDFYTQGCPSGSTGGAYHVVIPAQAFNSVISLDDANAKARQEAQRQANLQGGCQRPFNYVNTSGVSFSVRLTNLNTNQFYDFTAGAHGSGVLGNVPMGTYEIQVHGPGSGSFKFSTNGLDLTGSEAYFYSVGVGWDSGIFISNW